MRKSISQILLFLSVILYCQTVSANLNLEKLAKIKELPRFAVGSCNKEYKEPFIWGEVVKTKAQLFL